MKDYWEMTSDPRAQRIFNIVHPLVFQKEKDPAFEKVQNNWIFQCLDPAQKKMYLQNRTPKFLPSSKANYDSYI